MRAEASQSFSPTSDGQQEELFSEYVDAVFYDGISDGSGFSLEASNAARRENLSAGDAFVYDIVYQAVCEIADGKRASSEISFAVSDIEAATGEIVSDDQEPFSLSNVIIALLDDCPYELYWYDKTSNTSSVLEGDNFVIRMPVSAEYAVSGTAGSYEANTEVTGAATKAAAKAKEVASKAYHENLYDALDYYRGWICDSTDYDYSASGAAYGNPWQLIWVFDEDPSTKVVCEGYAKAFKYLCDLYDSANPGTEMTCYLTEGTISAPSISGPHMWNVVRMNNMRNYLVDVTNCDISSDTRRLFLVGTEDSKTEDYQGMERTIQYTITTAQGAQVTYRYEYHGKFISLMMYSEDEIKLCGTNYDINDRTDTFRDVRDPEKYYYEPVYLLANAGIVSGTSANYFSPMSPVTRGQFIFMLYRLAGSPEVSGPSGFQDVYPGAFYENAVVWAKEEGITSGKTAELFAPDSPVTRAEAVTFLQKYEKGDSIISEGFQDVYPTDYYAGAVGWALKNGITSGTTSSTFSPFEICFRAQAVTFLSKIAKG